MRLYREVGAAVELVRPAIEGECSEVAAFPSFSECKDGTHNAIVFVFI